MPRWTQVLLLITSQYSISPLRYLFNDPSLACTVILRSINFILGAIETFESDSGDRRRRVGLNGRGRANECCPVSSDRFFLQNFNDFFFPFPTDSVDNAQVSTKKVMSSDHLTVKYFILSITDCAYHRIKR